MVSSSGRLINAPAGAETSSVTGGRCSVSEIYPARPPPVPPSPDGEGKGLYYFLPSPLGEGAPVRTLGRMRSPARRRHANEPTGEAGSWACADEVFSSVVACSSKKTLEWEGQEMRLNT